jgi:hypothetical protein
MAHQRLLDDECSAEGPVNAEGSIYAGGQSTKAVWHETHVD